MGGLGSRLVSIVVAAGLVTGMFSVDPGRADAIGTGSISGRVTGGPGSVPVAARVVVLEPPSAPGEWNYVDGIETDADGDYAIRYLPDGDYLVLAVAARPSEWVDEYYGGATRLHGTPTVVTISGGVAVTGRDINLDTGVSVTGTVSWLHEQRPELDGIPLNVNVGSEVWNGSEWVMSGLAYDVTDDGSYLIQGLEQGTYRLRIDEPAVSEFAERAPYGTSWETTFAVGPDGASGIDATAVSDRYRAAGPNRYETAVKASQANFPPGGKVTDAVLVTGENFPDALAAAGLAGCVCGPVLLTQAGVLPAVVAEEIERLAPERVWIVGGASAVATSVADEVDALAGVEATRIAGDDRYDTAARVARAMAQIDADAGRAPASTAFIARGDSFADALACGAVAFAQRMPILLTRPSELPDATAGALDDLGMTDVVIAGGTAAVGTTVETELESVIGKQAGRLGGPDRYFTAKWIADWAIRKGWASQSFVGFAVGTNYPDALAAAPACAIRGGVLILTSGREVSSATEAFIESHPGSSYGPFQFYGGTSVLPQAIVDKIEEIYWSTFPIE